MPLFYARCWYKVKVGIGHTTHYILHIVYFKVNVGVGHTKHYISDVIIEMEQRHKVTQLMDKLA